MFNSSKWLNAKAKSRLLLKLSRMRTLIAYPPWLTNATLLDELYAWKHVDMNKSYLKNLLSSSKWDYTDLFEENEEHFFNDYPLPYAVPNAAYEASLNTFIAPAGSMNDRLFKPNYTAAFKYGLLGPFFGHEMFHGYDTNGKHELAFIFIF